MTDTDKRGESWHLDKRVPLSIIFVLIVQLAGFGMIYGQLENRVTHLEQQQRETAAAVRQVPERLARLEAILERIERQLAEPRF